MSCRLHFLIFLFLLFGLCSGPAYGETPEAMPPGLYKLDPRHSSVIFKISHLGFSYFTGRFDRLEGSFSYNPLSPEQSILDVTLYPSTIDTNDAELDDDLRGENWFDALHYPRATFYADHVHLEGDNRAQVTGDFTLHGVSHRLTLDVTFVGAGTLPLTDTPVMGFSATGIFNRSDYGISNLEPLIGDEIRLEIETEFDKE